MFKTVIFVSAMLCIVCNANGFSMRKRVQDDKGIKMIRRFISRGKREAHETLIGNNTKEMKNEKLEIFHVRFEEYKTPFYIAAALIISGLCKLLFHEINKYVEGIPESCVLICLGLLIGGIAYVVDPSNDLHDQLFTPHVFFVFIVPPIVIEAGYHMPKLAFFNNIGTIMVFAILGTLMNTLAIGFSLYSVYKLGFLSGMDELGGLTILDSCLFGSIISAVDPVAVISVFEEIHVNITLFIVVFGESLLNDGVAVVLYNMFGEFIKLGLSEIGTEQILLSLVWFAYVFFGGLFIGIFFGYLGAFITKFTKDSHIVEPTMVILFCYLSYLTAEIFHMSGIIAGVFGGFTLSAYANHNISAQSHTTIHFGFKMVANISETLIFILLGISTVSDFWNFFNIHFAYWTLIFVSVYRPISVFVLSFFVNKFRFENIEKVDQFVMAYGGLRGAIAFSLVSINSKEDVPAIKTMICTTIVVIYFTCFVQGSTIRPIVEWLRVRLEDSHDKCMFEEVSHRLIDHLVAGIEDITGLKGQHYWLNKGLVFHDKYISKHFIREHISSQDQELLETFYTINLFEVENLLAELQEKGEDRQSQLSHLRQNIISSNHVIAEKRRPSDAPSASYSYSTSSIKSEENKKLTSRLPRIFFGKNKKKVDKEDEEKKLKSLLRDHMYKKRESHTREPVSKQDQEVLLRRRLQEKQSSKDKESNYSYSD